jgi:hypothetical protein
VKVISEGKFLTRTPVDEPLSGSERSSGYLNAERVPSSARSVPPSASSHRRLTRRRSSCVRGWCSSPRITPAGVGSVPITSFVVKAGGSTRSASSDCGAQKA